jgi:hypothetical protein
MDIGCAIRGGRDVLCKSGDAARGGVDTFHGGGKALCGI